MERTITPLLVMMALTACAVSQPAQTATSVPLIDPSPPTKTSKPPEPTPKEDVIEYGEVTFDGNECTVSGPSELQTGKYTIVFNDTSEQPGLQLYLLGFDEGKSMQGMIDLVKKGFFPENSKILYAHLGGAPALNGYAYTYRNG